MLSFSETVSNIYRQRYKILPKGKLPQGNIQQLLAYCIVYKSQTNDNIRQYIIPLLFMIFQLAFVNLLLCEFSIIIIREMQIKHSMRIFKHEKRTFNPFPAVLKEIFL